MKLNRSFKAIIAIATLYILNSCSGMDSTYEEYLEHSDIIYPGKVRSIGIFTGKKQIKFKFLLSSDPKVNNIRIFWNGKQDSIEAEISQEEIGAMKEVLIPEIEEGYYTFVFQTYDKTGRASVPAEVFGRVYGDEFQSRLPDRYISSCINIDENKVRIVWENPYTSYADVQTEVIYEDTEGVSRTLCVLSEDKETILEDYKAGKSFRYRTLVKPDSTCMDYMPTPLSDQNVWAYYDEEKMNAWSIKDFSSRDAERGPDRCIDGYEIDDAKRSYWVNDTKGSGYPHWIIIDMDKVTSVDGFYFVQRVNGYNAQIKDMEIFTNATGDDSDDWESLGKFTLSKKSDRIHVWLKEQRKIRYVKFVFYNDWGNSKNISLMEVGAVNVW